MIRYAPVNLIRSVAPLGADLTPSHPTPPSGIPSWGTNLIIMASGIGIGLAAYPYKKKPFGDLLVHAGGSIAGIGLIFTILDFAGFRSGNL